MLACFTVLCATIAAPALAADDVPAAAIGRCTNAPRVTCVVDGDTMWWHGTKIRLADINTPEISRPGCRAERELGERATLRLIALLNRAPFTLLRDGRDEDRYGRKLRIVMQDGRSLGEQLVREGLAERWTGRRGDWCTGRAHT